MSMNQVHERYLEEIAADESVTGSTFLKVYRAAEGNVSKITGELKKEGLTVVVEKCKVLHRVTVLDEEKSILAHGMALGVDNALMYAILGAVREEVQ